MSTAMIGKVRTLPPHSDWGFIAPAGGGRDLFFHVDQVEGKVPRKGERVSFILSNDLRGRPCAMQVRALSIQGGKQ